MEVVCVLFPNLALRAALGERQELMDRPLALGPQHDASQIVGEVSPAAHRAGVRAGMGLGEAMDVCPELTMVDADPGRAARAWERVVARLESIGAGVESRREGEAFFSATGLLRLYDGLDGVLATTRERVGAAARIGAAPTRLAAYAVAHRGKVSPVVPAEHLDAFLRGLPLSSLLKRLEGPEPEVRALLASLSRLGIHDLGALADLPRDAVADRFGRLGLQALDLSLGREERIRPRTFEEALAEAIDLPEASSGRHLGGALTILTDRLATGLARRGRTARSLALDARLAGSGSWSCVAAPRQPTARAEILRMLLAPRIEQLPRPAHRLELTASRLGPGSPEQAELARRPEESRRRRLDEAARQVRAAVGDGGLMRVLDGEAGSHLPERRTLLTPYLALGGGRAGR